MEFKRPNVSPSTLAKDYKKIERCVNLSLPKKSIGDALAKPTGGIAIRDWLVANKPANSAKRILTQINACCDWAVKSQLIESNPFVGMAADIRVPKGESEDTDINPFSLEERDRIIEGFRSDRHYKHYAPLIEFLFMTGCRPSEGVALQWKHIIALASIWRSRV